MRQQQISKAAEKAQKKVGGRDPHAESKQRVQKVSDAIASPFFLAFSRMLILVGQVIQTVSAWLENCPCHSRNQDLAAAVKNSWWLRMKVWAGDCGKEVSAGTVICPLRGCLAPFLAAGRLNAFLDELLDVANSHVIRAAVGLNGPDKKLLAQNFNAAKGRLVTFLSLIHI